MGIQIYISSFTAKSLLKYKSYSHFKDSEVNILGSFGTLNTDYYEILIKNRDKFNDAILDSGAYTINNSGATNLSIDGFKCYCKSLPKDFFKFIISYDEIFKVGGFEKNYENILKLKKAGIHTIPVIHDYEAVKFNEIEFYLNKGYDLIALGAARNKNKNLPSAVNRIVKNGRKVHVLGVTSYKKLKGLPVHYCDSSNWTKAVVYGYIYYWNENDSSRDPLNDDMTDEIHFYDKDKWPEKDGKFYFGTNPNNSTYPWQKELEYYLKEMFGFKYTDLYGHDRYLNRVVVNLHYFTVLQEKLREFHIRNNIFAQQ